VHYSRLQTPLVVTRLVKHDTSDLLAALDRQPRAHLRVYK
jgi:hypothetical protein